MLSSEEGSVSSYVKRHVRKSGEERRQEILDATLVIISEKGLEGATVSRIASAVGLTPGALYRHFDSRATLIAEANRLANMRAMNWTSSSDNPDILQRMEELGATHAGWASDNFNTVVRPFFLELASGPDDAERLSVTAFGSFRAVVGMAEEAKSQGLIREDVMAVDVAWALHMFAWTEDIAVMSGATEALEDGILRRNLKRMLDSFRT
jgi:AcrR family transcriptional regulator